MSTVIEKYFLFKNAELLKCLVRERFEDSEISDGHHCATLKRAGGVNSTHHSSHLSKTTAFFEHTQFAKPCARHRECNTEQNRRGF